MEICSCSLMRWRRDSRGPGRASCQYIVARLCTVQPRHTWQHCTRPGRSCTTSLQSAVSCGTLLLACFQLKCVCVFFFSEKEAISSIHSLLWRRMISQKIYFLTRKFNFTVTVLFSKYNGLNEEHKG